MSYPSKQTPTVQDTYMNIVMAGRSMSREEIRMHLIDLTPGSRKPYSEIFGVCLRMWDPTHPFLAVEAPDDNTTIAQATRDFIGGQYYPVNPSRDGKGGKHGTIRKVIIRLAELYDQDEVINRLEYKQI